jgi:transposase
MFKQKRCQVGFETRVSSSEFSIELESAKVTSLERDPLLAERLKRLRTVPGVGPITALTWALEMGDFTRFPSTKEAISYCGLCGDESSSADEERQRGSTNRATLAVARRLVA